MTKLLDSAKHALAIARGEEPAAVIWVNGFRYVLASELAAAEALGAERMRERNLSAVGRFRTTIRQTATEMSPEQLRDLTTLCDKIAAAIQALPTTEGT